MTEVKINTVSREFIHYVPKIITLTTHTKYIPYPKPSHGLWTCLSRIFADAGSYGLWNAPCAPHWTRGVQWARRAQECPGTASVPEKMRLASESELQFFAARGVTSTWREQALVARGEPDPRPSPVSSATFARRTAAAHLALKPFHNF